MKISRRFSACPVCRQRIELLVFRIWSLDIYGRLLVFVLVEVRLKSRLLCHSSRTETTERCSALECFRCICTLLIILSRPSGGVIYKDVVFDWTLDCLFATPRTILDYNSQWRYRQITVTVYSAIATIQTVCLHFTVHAMIPLGLLSHTSHLVPVSYGGHSPSWVPELSPSHSHSSSWFTGTPFWTASSYFLDLLFQYLTSIGVCPITNLMLKLFTSDGQSASLSWCRAPIWNP
jgi:hypothetical protein